MVIIITISIVMMIIVMIVTIIVTVTVMTMITIQKIVILLTIMEHPIQHVHIQDVRIKLLRLGTQIAVRFIQENV